MLIHVIRASGGECDLEAKPEAIAQLISASVLDGFRTLGGRYVYFDANGLLKSRPYNAKATELYNSVCRLGSPTKDFIVGDVAIVSAADAPL